MSDLPPPPIDLPSPPFIHVPDIANFRDIGGYPLSSSTPSHPRSVRRGLVYRAADPSRIRPTGLSTLHTLSIRKVFDLRSVPEIQRQGPEWKDVATSQPSAFVTRTSPFDPLPPNTIERIWTPVFKEADYSPEKIGLRYKAYAGKVSGGFVQAYKDILANAGPSYKTILTHVASPSPEACVIHCTAGKDRTGVLVALLYLLAGVEPEVIAKEYALTDQGLAHLKPVFKERLLKNPALEGDEEGVERMIGAREENMRNTIKMIEEVYGSAERYVVEVVGLSEEEVQSLRRNLRCEDVPIH